MATEESAQRGKKKDDEKPLWNSLEVAKLVVPFLSSLILAVVGVVFTVEVANLTTQAAAQAKALDSLSQKRVALYDDLGRRANRMFSYYMFIGKWKQFSPADIIREKRETDEIVYTYQPFFSKDFMDAFGKLEAQLFRSFNGWGKDAKLRTSGNYRKDAYEAIYGLGKWDTKWDSDFAEQDNGQPDDNAEGVRAAYTVFLNLLPKELQIPQLPVRNIPAQDIAQPHVITGE